MTIKPTKTEIKYAKEMYPLPDPEKIRYIMLEEKLRDLTTFHRMPDETDAELRKRIYETFGGKEPRELIAEFEELRLVLSRRPEKTQTQILDDILVSDFLEELRKL